MLDFSLNLASLALTLSLGAATPTGLLPRQEWDGTRPGPAIECDGLLFPNYPTCEFTLAPNLITQYTSMLTNMTRRLDTHRTELEWN